MNPLSPESAERIRAAANAALLDDPDLVTDELLEHLRQGRERIATLEKQLSSYSEALWFYETWVAWFEGKLRCVGVDPTDMTENE